MPLPFGAETSPWDILFPFSRHPEPRFITDPLQFVPILYGRRVTRGKVIETLRGTSPGGQSVFVALSEGEIDSVVRWLRDNAEGAEIVESGVKVLGYYYRTGEQGVDDSETQAEYTADPTTLKRDQNRDYRTKSNTAYSETAYLIFVQNDDAFGGSTFDVKGLLVQSYNANGTPNGAKAWSDNGIWQLLDLWVSDKHGLGIDLSRFDIQDLATEAAYVGAEISSTEASTTVTDAQASPSKVCKVVSSEGFVVGRKVTVGVTDNEVEHVVGDAELRLKTAQTQAVDDAVIQKPARFTTNIVIDREQPAKRWIGEMLQSFLGYITHGNGKIQVRAERAHATNRLTDGGVEVWSSGTDLTNWDEGTATGTVNQDTSDKNEGASSARLDRSGAGADLRIGQDGVTLEPGRWYVVAFDVKQTSATTDGASVRIQNVTKNFVMNSDGVTTQGIAPPLRSETFDTTTAWARVEYLFKVPETSESSDSWRVRFYHQQSAQSDSLWLDDLEVYGPLGGVFKDTGYKDGMGIAEGSFRWSVDSKSREYNRIEVKFINEGGDVGPDVAFASDWEHQKRNRLRQQTIRANAVIDRDQAARIAKYHLARSRTLGPGCRFVAGPAALALQPGDVIAVTHAVPDWTRKLMRVTKLSIRGLGSNEETFCEIECDDYQESIYTDVSVPGRGLPTRPDPTLTLGVTPKARTVEFTFTLTEDGYSVRSFIVFMGTATAFDIEWNKVILQTKESDAVWSVPDADLETTRYFVAWALTDRGYIQSAEVSAFMLRVASADLDANADESASQLNLIRDSDFDDPSAWTEWPASGTNRLFPQVTAGGDYDNPSNAIDDDPDIATGAVNDPGDLFDSQTWDFGNQTGTKTGDLAVRHRENNANVSQQIYYSTNGGSGWTLLANSTTSWATSTINLVSVDITQVRVRADSDAVGGEFTGGNGEVSGIWFEDTSSAGIAQISGGVAEIQADGLGNTSRIVQDFPFGITAARQHFAVGEPVSLRVGAARLTSGQALDADVVIKLRQYDGTAGGGAWSQTLKTIAAANVGDAFKDYAEVNIAIDGSIPTSRLELEFATDSTKGVKLDKAMFVKGKRIPLWLPNPNDMSGASGTVGDYSTGGGGESGGGFPAGGGKTGAPPLEV